MAHPKGTHLVISASLTTTGAPAYALEDGTWTDSLNKAFTFDAADESTLGSMLTRAKNQEAEVCDPYEFAVKLIDGGLDPLSAREQIRATGPATRLRRPDAT